ncbi:MAG: zinc metallopeptidase [Pseudomonadales bacterium]|nr:zinc metallopeptidase [Pseudomonadales bacterium]
MIWFVLIALVLALVFGPQLWVRWVMRRHGVHIEGMPGTGGEFAEHLIRTHDLAGVVVEETTGGDHYDPSARAVRLSSENFGGKSLTAVAVAAHEVGHAIQHGEEDGRLERRGRLAMQAAQIGRLSVGLLYAAPVIGLLLRHPLPVTLLALIGLSGIVARMLVHAVTLPIEWDASFGKALPIIRRGQFVAPDELEHVEQVLRAAAYTYVAAALADILNLARWASILLRR